MLNLEIVTGRLHGPALVQDYYAGSPKLAPFFSGSPWDPEAYRRRAGEVAARFDTAARERVAAAMRPSGAGAVRRLEALVREGGFFVTTGQQTGLFTGPLYTIYKALSAVRLAAALEPVLGKPVVPLFWVASTDHDFEEVNHAGLLDAQNVLHRLELPADPAQPPVSMANRRLGAGIESTLAELAQVLPQNDFTTPLLALARSAYRPDATMAEAFADMLAGLLEPFGLVLVDPAHPELRRLAAPVLGREIAHAAENEEALVRQTQRLVESGYHAQVAVGAGAVNVSYEDESGRERLIREGGGFLLRRTKRRLSREEVLATLEAQPERFSPNVLLRPVVESTLFPTVAYVAGPSELSYFAQTGCLFKAHGLEMPLIHPRASAALVERKVAKVVEKFGLELEDFHQPTRELAARVVRDDMPPEVEAAVAALRDGLNQGYDALARAAEQLDPTLKGPLMAARNASHVALREAEKKIVSHVKARSAVTTEQLEKAAANLYPGGAPQERVLNVLQYIARYGPELLAEIAQALPIALAEQAPDWQGVECATA